MSSKSLVLAIVGATTVAAAAAGGYVAVRLNPAERPAVVAIARPAPAVAQAPAKPVTPPVTPALDPAPDARKAATEAGDVPVAPPAVAPADPKSFPPVATAPPDPVIPPANAPPPATASASGPPVAETLPPVTDAPPPPADPSKPPLEELIVKEDAVIGIRLDAAISTDSAKVEDHVSARVARDVMVNGRTAIPSGARLEGTVTVVEHGGKFKDRARIGVRFETLILADNTRVPLRTETIYRNGEAPTGEATSKIGASAVLGAILGRVVGGKKGTAIGGAVGAAGGTAAVMAGGPNEAVIPAGTPLTVRLTSPVTLLVERHLF